MCGIAETQSREGKKVARAQAAIGFGRVLSARSRGEPVSRDMFRRRAAATTPLGVTGEPLGG